MEIIGEVLGAAHTIVLMHLHWTLWKERHMTKDIPTPEELDAISDKMLKPDNGMTFTEYVEYMKQGGDEVEQLKGEVTKYNQEGPKKRFPSSP